MSHFSVLCYHLDTESNESFEPLKIDSFSLGEKPAIFVSFRTPQIKKVKDKLILAEILVAFLAFYPFLCVVKLTTLLIDNVSLTKNFFMICISSGT